MIDFDECMFKGNSYFATMRFSKPIAEVAATIENGKFIIFRLYVDGVMTFSYDFNDHEAVATRGVPLTRDGFIKAVDSYINERVSVSENEQETQKGCTEIHPE